ENVCNARTLPLAAPLANLRTEALSRPTATWGKNRLVGFDKASRGRRAAPPQLLAAAREAALGGRAARPVTGPGFARPRRVPPPLGPTRQPPRCLRPGRLAGPRARVANGGAPSVAPPDLTRTP